MARSTTIGGLLGLLMVSLGLVSPAIAQNPSQAQISAVRQACPADYQTYCSNVPTGGSASLACLKRNAQSLSEPCRQAVAAIGSPAPARNPAPANYRAGHRSASAGCASRPDLCAADVAATGSDAAAPRLRHGLPNLLQ